MRFLYCFLLLFAGMACEPSITTSDFPYRYEQSEIRWTRVKSLVLPEENLDSSISSWLIKEEALLHQLSQQPAFQIRGIQLIDLDQAIIELSAPSNLDTLRYDQQNNDLFLWWPNRADETFYFKQEFAGDELWRPFIFYWKMQNEQNEDLPFFRLQEGPVTEVEAIIHQHLAYEPLFVKGDTIQVIQGLMVYRKI